MKVKILKRKGKCLNEETKQGFGAIQIVHQIINLLSDGDKGTEELLIEISQLLTDHLKETGYLCNIYFDGKNYPGTAVLSSQAGLTKEVWLADGRKIALEVSCLEKAQSANCSYFTAEDKDFVSTILELFTIYYNENLARKELLRSKANLRTIIENTNTAYILLDKVGKIISFNKQMLDGYFFVNAVKLSRGNIFLDCFNPERKNLFQRYIDIVDSDKKPFSFEENFTRNKTKYFFLVTIVPVIENEKIQGYNISAQDITLRKNFEKERQKIIDDLMQRNRDLEQFSYMISHNIRSPLATLLGLAHVLGDGLTKEEKDFVIKGIKSSAETLDNMVKDLNQILELKKDHSHQKTEVNLNKKILTIIGSIESIISDSGAEIEYDFTEAPVVKSIKAYIQSILFNLITNAIKYTAPGIKPQIKIWSKPSDRGVNIYFKDNGIGIDMEKHGNDIFGLYKKIYPGTEGKGMGLFMVKTQIEAMGGSISLESKAGAGSLFIVSLP